MPERIRNDGGDRRATGAARPEAPSSSALPIGASRSIARFRTIPRGWQALCTFTAGGTIVRKQPRAPVRLKISVFAVALAVSATLGMLAADPRRVPPGRWRRRASSSGTI